MHLQWRHVIPLLISFSLARPQSGRFYTSQGYLCEWSISSSTFESTLVIDSPSVSWIGFGVSPNGRMLGTDAFIGMPATGRLYRVKLGPSGPEAGVFANTATAYSDGSVQVNTAGQTVLTVRRTLDAESSSELAIDSDGRINLIMAWRTDPQPSQRLGKHNGFHQETIGNQNGKPIKSQAAISGSGVSREIVLSDHVKLHYSFMQNKISITAELDNAAWLAIGFSDKGKMTDSWVVVGNPDINDVAVHQFRLQAMTEPDPTLLLDVDESSCTKSDGRTTLTFSRPLTLGEIDHEPFNINPSGFNYLIWAHGQDRQVSLTQHDHSSRGSVLVDWSSGRSRSIDVDDTGIRKAHGSLMLIAWTVLIPIGICIARFFKDDNAKWFLMHRVLMILSVLMSTIAFILIISSVPSNQHFRSWHGVIGIIVQIGAVCQPIIAIFRNRKRAAWEKQHRWTAAFLYLLAILNCILGAQLLSSSTNTILMVVFSVLFAICGILLMAVLECRRGAAPRHKAQEDIEDDQRPHRPLDHVSESDDDGLDLSEAQEPWGRNSKHTVDGF